MESTRTTRNSAHSPHVEAIDEIPEVLKRLAAWMGTRFVQRADGKLDKPPHSVRAGHPVIKADKTNPENWATFDEAREALERGDVDGIGLVFTHKDPYTGIDQDGVIDPETGETYAQAAEIVADFPTYWETSTSGTGLRGVCIGDKPGALCKKGPVEIYDGGSGARFLVLTGQALSAEREVRDCSEQVRALYGRLFPNEATEKKARQAQRTGGVPLEREELLKKARKAKTGPKFRKLFDVGDTSGFKSPSEADFSLINNLIFWTAGDEDLTVELFKSSALFRPPPEKDRGYVRRSVKKAFSKYTGSYYRPRRPRANTTPAAESPLAPYLALLLDPSRWTGRKAATAYKAFTALVILAPERGIETDNGRLRVGVDVRTLAERSGVERATLCKSTLPFLIKARLISWRRCQGKSTGEFVLLTPSDTIKECGSFNGVTGSEILEVLKQLIRMRSGRAELDEVARLGPLAMLCLVTMAVTRRGISLAELVKRTGRRKDNLRRKMRDMLAAGIVRSPREDFYVLPLDFWQRYDKELSRSGITGAEKRQKDRHERDRIKREEALRKKAQGEREKVVEMHPSMGKPNKRRRPVRPAADGGAKVVRIATRHQDSPALKETRRYKPMWEDRDWTTPEEDVLLAEYDRKCERAQERIGEVFADRAEWGRARLATRAAARGVP